MIGHAVRRASPAASEAGACTWFRCAGKRGASGAEPRRAVFPVLHTVNAEARDIEALFRRRDPAAQGQVAARLRWQRQQSQEGMAVTAPM